MVEENTEMELRGDFSRRYERSPKVQLTEEQNTYLVKQ
jgi:hypothetical protein